jgi:transcriptional regulator with XRE-family HTH domain
MLFNLRFSKEELEKIGSRMHSARVLTGLKREDFALKQQLSSTSIKNWELGRILPRQDGINAIINAFKECGIVASIEWILYGKGPSPHYLDSIVNGEEEKSLGEFTDEQINFFKKAQRSKGFNPVVIEVKDKQMEPTYKMGDILGGIIVSPEFVKSAIAKNLMGTSPWLITRTEGNFVPAFIFLQGSKWLMNTLLDNELKECAFPSIAKIKWHYAAGTEI